MLPQVVEVWRDRLTNSDGSLGGNICSKTNARKVTKYILITDCLLVKYPLYSLVQWKINLQLM